MTIEAAPGMISAIVGVEDSNAIKYPKYIISREIVKRYISYSMPLQASIVPRTKLLTSYAA